ncbi:hypothetical protein GQ43DRAFT_354569, partial [Delitschia confertaspora ATCC 74209]
EDSLNTSWRTIVRYIKTNYELYSKKFKGRLSVALSPIHTSTDLWISPHLHSLLAVYAQWVDEVYMFRKALLSLPECVESRS